MAAGDLEGSRGVGEEGVDGEGGEAWPFVSGEWLFAWEVWGDQGERWSEGGEEERSGDEVEVVLAISGSST